MTLHVLSNGAIDSADVQGAMPDRLFREAWILSGNAIEIDLGAAKIKAHETRSKWFEWRRHDASNPVVYAGKQFWSDPTAGQLVDGEVGYARDVEDDAPGTYSLLPGWKAMDGTYLAIADFAAIKALKAAYRNHYNAAFVASEMKAAEIEAAADVEALEAIVNGMLADIG